MLELLCFIFETCSSSSSSKMLPIVNVYIFGDARRCLKRAGLQVSTQHRLINHNCTACCVWTGAGLEACIYSIRTLAYSYTIIRYRHTGVYTSQQTERLTANPAPFPKLSPKTTPQTPKTLKPESTSQRPESEDPKPQDPDTSFNPEP